MSWAKPKKYRTIYLDPPWPEQGGGKVKRGADRHYPLMKVSEIMAMKDVINSVADVNCHMYMWVTNNYLAEGLRALGEFGFSYKTKIEWIKGDPQTHLFNNFGLGQYFRGITETCLFGVKGNLIYKVINGKRAQGKTAFFANRREHSRKPEEMRAMIELVSYEPRIEFFARESFPGWDRYNKQI